MGKNHTAEFKQEAVRVARELTDLIEWRGKPEMIVSPVPKSRPCPHRSSQLGA